VFDTFAVTGAYPNESSTGNVNSVPLPTTVLIVPATIPAAKIASACSGLTPTTLSAARIAVWVGAAQRAWASWTTRARPVQAAGRLERGGLTKGWPAGEDNPTTLSGPIGGWRILPGSRGQSSTPTPARHGALDFPRPTPGEGAPTRNPSPASRSDGDLPPKQRRKNSKPPERGKTQPRACGPLGIRSSRRPARHPGSPCRAALESSGCLNGPGASRPATAPSQKAATKSTRG
jgi:hypothetical protein